MSDLGKVLTDIWHQARMETYGRMDPVDSLIGAIIADGRIQVIPDDCVVVKRDDVNWIVGMIDAVDFAEEWRQILAAKPGTDNG